MKTYITIIIAIIFSISLVGCESNKNQSVQDTTLPKGPTVLPKETTSKETTSNEATNIITVPAESDIESLLSGGTFNPDTFASKIKGGFYASGNHLFVLSDQLYLYNTEADEIISSVSAEQSQFTVKCFNNGYLTSGFENGELTCILYDDMLQEKQRLILSKEVADDFIFVDATAISPDGKQVAFAGLRGVYLYDVETKSTDILFDFESDAGINHNKITIMEHLAFISDGKSIIYTGLGNTIPMIEGEEGFSIYGYISVDGISQKLIKKDSYGIESLSFFGNTLILPQSFTKADGTLLIVDTITGNERLIHFDSSREGKDGVFSSSQGEYVATAILSNDMTIHIYNTNTGELLHTETIPDNGQDYFYRIPQILILDESRTCIVFMGRTIDNVETLTTVFQF